MLEQVFHWLSGYVEFQIDGDGARVFTVAAKRGLGLWGYRRVEGRARARIKPRDYKKFRGACRRCQAVSRITKKRGLPFQVRRLWRRKGLLAGALCGAGLYVFLSGFLWGVEVTGAETVTPRQVFQAGEAWGVYVGAPKSRLQPKSAGQGILSALPELSWVSVNTDGCFAQIAVREGAEKPQVDERGELSNIVASREGQVVEIESALGRPEVQPGETVVAGQLLIAGLYQEIPDPYGPQPEKLFQRAGPARGRVIAETYREFTVQVGGSRPQWVEEGRQTAVWVNAFGLRIPLGLWSRPPEEARVWREARRASLLGVELPLALEREETVFLREESRSLTQEEQKEAALLKLREAQRSTLPEGSSIKAEELEYIFAEGLCVLNAKCRCLEDIAQLQIISVE